VQLTMQVKMTNSEMRSPEDLVPLFEEASQMISNHRAHGTLRDINGNAVGHFEIVGDDERSEDKALVSREQLEELQRLDRLGYGQALKASIAKLIEGIQS
jgi:hypothetical protein